MFLRRVQFLSLLLLLLAATQAAADLKLKTKNTSMGNSSESTTYIKGARQRGEMLMGPARMTTIMQCDRKRTITISDACRTYMIAPMDPETGMPAAAQAPPASGRTRQGGTVTIHNTSSDTGERQPMFGYTARHIKGTMSMRSSPDACNPSDMRMETDGWYADFSAAGATCSMTPRPGAGAQIRPDCQDRYIYTGSRSARLGYPMKLTTTVYSQGQRFTTTTETLELSRATLDPELFDVPQDYTEVDSYQGLMCTAAMTGQGATPPMRSRSRRGGRGPICVARFGNLTEIELALEEWREALLEDFNQLRVEAIPLEATERRELQNEAEEKGCGHILYTDVATARRQAARRPGAAARRAAGYESTLKFELMPNGDYIPRLEADSAGRGDSYDTSGAVAMEAEAQEVADELRQPWPR